MCRKYKGGIMQLREKRRKKGSGLMLGCAVMLSACILGSAAEPDIEMETECETEFATRITYDALDYVEPGEYKGMKLVIPMLAEPTEEEIENHIRSDLYTNDLMDEITEGTVEEEDIVKLHFRAFEKEDVERLTPVVDLADMEVMIGRNTTGFEEVDQTLVGAQIGSVIELDVVYPKDTDVAELADREATLVLEIHSVSRYPELTDELAIALTQGSVQTVEEYKTVIREGLTGVTEENQEQTRENLLFARIEENTKIKGYPEELVEQVVDASVEYLSESAKEIGTDLDTLLSEYYGMSAEDYYAFVRENTEVSLRQEMILCAIGDMEDIELEEEEFQEQLKLYAAEHGFETVEELLMQAEEGTLRVGFRMEKILNWLVEHNTFVTEE